VSEAEADAQQRPPPTLADLERCFEGAVPSVLATAALDGTPNITYLSCVRRVGDERIALSNQFFSKTQQNLAENPQASLILIDPANYDEFRLTLRYERTERRGPVFDRLRDDVDNVAHHTRMDDVFKLRAADVYRVLGVEKLETPASRRDPEALEVRHLTRAARSRPDAGAVAELAAQLSRSADLDTLVSTTVSGLARLLGYERSVLLLLDEDGRRLYTIASHGYAAEGIGSEVEVGDGPIGLAAERCAPVRLGNLRQMAKYSNTVRSGFDSAQSGVEREIPLPELPDPQSRLAVPAVAFGQLVGVIVVESPETVAFDEQDEQTLGLVASVVGAAVEGGRARAAMERISPAERTPEHRRTSSRHETQVRFFAADGSTFLDGDYLIKGVAGRILWSLLTQHQRDGRDEFTNREVRLDPTLELPEVRDNLESRLILLKRRLDEREAPISIEKTGRGRFRLVVETTLVLDAVGGDS
jgi:predicted pyridoxine 5'-phosphate oxidase superfamily flavin-nucleotide-binding protein